MIQEKAARYFDVEEKVSLLHDNFMIPEAFVQGVTGVVKATDLRMI